MYQHAKEKLDLHGEVIVAMDSGRVYELHLDSRWDGGTSIIEFEDGDGQTIVLNGDNIESYWTHPSHRME